MAEKHVMSIISPVYNGETYIGRFLETVIAQTWPDIELILINDGSTDGTDDIVHQYEQRLADRGIQFTYIVQENGGQAAAINQGLKIFRGEFLSWFDSDDVMHPDFAAVKATYLLEHPEVDLLITGKNNVDEQDLSTVLYRATPSPLKGSKEKRWLFWQMLEGDSIAFMPGCYCIRSSFFVAHYADRQIYPGRGGQNYQMLLPAAYFGQVARLDKMLFDYVIRMESHSHVKNSSVSRNRKYMDIATVTVKAMHIPEEARALRALRNKHAKRMFAFATRPPFDPEAAQECYDILSSQGTATKSQSMYNYLMQRPHLRWLLALIREVQRLTANLIAKAKRVVKKILGIRA